MPVSSRALLITALSFASWIACTRSSADCTCDVAINGERRGLVCGETECVGGVQVTCTDTNQSVERGACVSTTRPPPAEVDAAAPGTTPPDPACDDLRTFCNTSCAKPINVASDCQATASTGDPSTCASWQATYGVLCRP